MNKKIKNNFIIIVLFTSILSALAYGSSEDFFKNSVIDETIRFDSLLFKDEKIQEDNLEYLDEIVETIKTYVSENKNIGITIVGHTSLFLDKIYTIDNNKIGNVNIEKNKIYSNEIKEYFVKNGIDPNKIFIELRATNEENLSNSATVTMYVKRNLDNDNDGIENSLDKCPNTKKGYSVGSDGCKLKTMVVLLKGKKKNSSIIVNTKGGSIVVNKVNQFVVIESPSLPPTDPIDMTGSLSMYIGSEFSSIEEELTYTFYFDGDDLVEKSAEKVKKMLEELSKRENSYIKIIGHTDTVGTFEKNSIIAKSRAEKISKVIMNSNIPYMKIDTESYSESNLAIPTKDDVYEPLNRRVEVFIN